MLGHNRGDDSGGVGDSRRTVGPSYLTIRECWKASSCAQNGGVPANRGLNTFGVVCDARTPKATRGADLLSIIYLVDEYSFEVPGEVLELQTFSSLAHALPPVQIGDVLRLHKIDVVVFVGRGEPVTQAIFRRANRASYMVFSANSDDYPPVPALTSHDSLRMNTHDIDRIQELRAWARKSLAVRGVKYIEPIHNALENRTPSRCLDLLVLVLKVTKTSEQWELNVWDCSGEEECGSVATVHVDVESVRYIRSLHFLPRIPFCCKMKDVRVSDQGFQLVAPNRSSSLIVVPPWTSVARNLVSRFVEGSQPPPLHRLSSTDHRTVECREVASLRSLQHVLIVRRCQVRCRSILEPGWIGDVCVPYCTTCDRTLATGQSSLCSICGGVVRFVYHLRLLLEDHQGRNVNAELAGDEAAKFFGHLPPVDLRECTATREALKDLLCELLKPSTFLECSIAAYAPDHDTHVKRYFLIDTQVLPESERTVPSLV
mmetsp:Transcript_16135/g.32655  ORF Transcript_16135/g.32655 Transcript_16135/m.32655 type:complete len:487 (-) Transcript_16135:1804-3264(-)